MRSGVTNPDVLVIGYGNALRGDDGVGWHAAVVLAGLIDDPSVGILPCHQLTPDLAPPLAAASLAIFIDASADSPPGHVARRRVWPCPDSVVSSAHHLTPNRLLSWSRDLYGSAPAAVIYTVGVLHLDLSEELSDPVRRALPRVVNDAHELVLRWTARRGRTLTHGSPT